MKLVRKWRDVVYRVPQLNVHDMYHLWSSTVQESNDAGTLDRVRFIQSLIVGLNLNFKKNHRQDSIGLAQLTSPSAVEWSEVQADLIGLLSHAEAIVVGFAITQLNVIDREATLDCEAVLPALVNAFELKHKTHIVGAVNLLDRIAENSDLRSQAIVTATAGLSHANADVRDWVLQLLAKHLRAEDAETIEFLQQNEPTFAASVRPQVRGLLQKLSGKAASDQTGFGVGDFD